MYPQKLELLVMRIGEQEPAVDSTGRTFHPNAVRLVWTRLPEGFPDHPFRFTAYELIGPVQGTAENRSDARAAREYRLGQFDSAPGWVMDMVERIDVRMLEKALGVPAPGGTLSDVASNVRRAV